MGETTLRINADVQGALTGVNQVSQATEKLSNDMKNYGNNSQKAFEQATVSSKQLKEEIKLQTAAIKEMEREEKKLAASSEKLTANEQKRWKRVQGEISLAKKELTELQNKQVELNNTTDKTGAMFKKFAGILGVAFSVGAIVSFAKSSIQAYDEQQKSETKLLVALKGRKDIQESLIRQAEDLRKTTRFDDSDIINAQAQLAKFLGANEATIKKLTPLILDFATTQNMDLAGAANVVSKAIGSSTNSLGRYGIQVDAAAGSQERLNQVTWGLTRLFEGQAVAAGKTGAGAMIRFKNAVGELQESIGGFLARSLTPLFEGLINMVTPTESAQSQFDKLSMSVENTAKSIVPLLDEYDQLTAKTNPSNVEQARMNELIQMIATNVPTAITGIDEYGRVIGVSTDKARDFVAAQNALLVQKNADAIEEWEDKIVSAERELGYLKSQLEGGKYMLENGEWTNYSAEEMANFADRAAKAGEQIIIAKNAIKLLSGEKIEIGGGEDIAAKATEIFDVVNMSTEALKKMLKEMSDRYGDMLNQLADEDTMLGNTMNADKFKLLQKEIKFREEGNKKIKKDHETTLEENLASLDKYIEEVNKKTFDIELGFGGMQSAAEFEKQIEENLKGFAEQMANNPMMSGDDSWDAQMYDQMYENLKEFEKQMQEEWDAMQKWGEDHPLAAAFGFENQEQLDQMKDYAGQVLSFVNEIVDQQVQASERLVDDLNTRIEEQQALVEQENEDKQEGLANNYDIEKENLAKMQKARDEAIKDRERMIKIQRTLSTVESSIALVTATANILKGFSGIPVVGVVLGLAAVAAMIAGFVMAQKTVKSATQMEQGGEAHYGLLKGKRHSQGGIPIEAEDGEFFVNRRSTEKYRPLLEAINNDKLYFNRTFLNKMPQAKSELDYRKNFGEIVKELKRGKPERVYGNGYYIETIGGYTKKVNLN